MKYKPERDIPKAVREIKSLSPSLICEWIKNHRTRINKATKKREQVIRKPPSISNFFKRNPKLGEQLRKEIEEFSKPDAVMSEIDLQNGSFRKIPCIDKWILQLEGRGAKEHAIGYMVSHIKYICMGRLPQPRKRAKEGKPSIFIEDWGLKHPRALTLEDCLRYNSAMIKNECNRRNYRLAMRNFLRSRNVAGWDTISGKLAEEKGKYAHLYATKEEIIKIFAWLKTFNYEAYLCAKFSFKCGGARCTATLEANVEFVNKEDRTIILFEKASRNAPKRRVTKEIPDDFYEELKPRIERGGKLFNIKPDELRKILRACYMAIIPNLNIPMPFHFWRHQFAQHMLRATNWNYSIVALFGHWKVQTLEDYYGAMDRREVLPYAREKLREI